MKYLIDSYAPYYAGSLLGKVAESINWFFVDMPFFILRFFSIGILLIQEMLDQSEMLMAKQQDAYNLSLTVLNNLGGKQIAKGSILALLILLSAYYLLYNFFVSKKNFSKVLIHYLVVFGLFIFWFGSIATPSGSKSGGTFLVESVSNISKGIKNNFTSASSDFSKISNEQALDNTPLFNATIKQTFYFVNTGSLDGIMENGEKIDEKKLLMPSKLSKEEKKKFEKEREKYIGSIKDDNPYVAMTTEKTMEKLVAIFTGNINLMVTSYPALYVSGMLSVVQLIVTMLIILAPVFFVMSFVPACQTMLFKFFKLLIGILFLPVILGVFLAVFFWANKMIDSVYLNAMKLVSQPLLVIMSGGIFVLVGNVVLIIVKFFLYKSIWKNKYNLLSYFTDNQVEQPEIMEKVNEKATEIKDRAKDVTVGGLEVAAGAYTGNQMLVADGLGKVMPKSDKAMNLGGYRFIDNGNPKAGQNGLDEWLNKQDEDVSDSKNNTLDDVEFVEVGDDSLDKQEMPIEKEGFDHSLDHDKMASMFDELSDTILENGDTISVDNLDELMLDIGEDEIDRLALEQIEKETFSDKTTFDVDREFSEDAFFGQTNEIDLNEEGW